MSIFYDSDFCVLLLICCRNVIKISFYSVGANSLLIASISTLYPRKHIKKLPETHEKISIKAQKKKPFWLPLMCLVVPIFVVVHDFSVGGADGVLILDAAFAELDLIDPSAVVTV